MLDVEKRLQIYISVSSKWIFIILCCLLTSSLGDIWSFLAFLIAFSYFQKQLGQAIAKAHPKSHWVVATIVLGLLCLKFLVESQTKTSCLQSSGDSLFGYTLYTIWTSIFVWEVYFYTFIHKKLIINTKDITKARQ